MFMLFFFIIRQPPISTRTNTLVPYTTLSRANAITLNFQDGKFVGWFLGNANGTSRYSTISGIGVGTTRAKAKQSVSIVDVEDSTLGEEFSIGTGDSAIGGMFAAPGDTAKIDALFAGANCFFR